jgi:hypothetical protein
MNTGHRGIGGYLIHPATGEWDKYSGHDLILVYAANQGRNEIRSPDTNRAREISGQ